VNPAVFLFVAVSHQEIQKAFDRRGRREKSAEVAEKTRARIVTDQRE
jgi:hypothetical protein